MRRGYEFIWPHCPQFGERAALVLRVGIGIDEYNRDALSAVILKSPCQRADLLTIDRPTHTAVGKRPLVRFDAHVAVSDRDEITPQTPGMAAIPPAHFEHIAKTPRSDDANLGAAPLEQRVRADRRAVHD